MGLFSLSQHQMHLPTPDVALSTLLECRSRYGAQVDMNHNLGILLRTYNDNIDVMKTKEAALNYAKSVFTDDEKLRSLVEQKPYEDIEKLRGESIKEELRWAKKYRHSAERAKLVFDAKPGVDVNGFKAVDIDNYYVKAKSSVKNAKKLNYQYFGEPKGLKALKKGGMLAAVGLLTFAGIKAYQFVFGGNSTVPPEQGKNPLKESAVSDSTQIVDTMAVDVRSQDTVLQQQIPEISNDSIPMTDTIVISIHDQDTVSQSQNEEQQPEEVVTQQEQSSVVEEVVKEPENNTSKSKKSESDVMSIEEKRAAFNRTIDKIQEALTTEGIKCENYTTVKNDTLWKVAVKTLKNEGIEKPTNKEINTRIALIALLNDIDDVNKLSCNQALKIPSVEMNAYIENHSDIKDLLELLIS